VAVAPTPLAVQSLELAQLAPDSFVVTARGDLARDHALELRDLLFPLVAALHARVVLDLGEATALDPSVVGVIDSAATMMRHAGAELVIVARDPRVLWLLELTGVDQVARLQRGLAATQRRPLDARREGSLG
jgi:anti-anti-sigma factor